MFERVVFPHLAWDHTTVTLIVAVFGTTISPYLFFWQAAQEQEDLRSAGGAALPHGVAEARRHLRRIRWDTYVGMGFSNSIAFFIILSTAATLHVAGMTNIETSAQAAGRCVHLAGPFAFWLFSTGIIATGMLAVPVLAGSAAYAVAEAFHWRTGLNLPDEGKKFYSIIAFATLGGVALNFTPIDPIKALFWSAVINGVIAVPIMAVMMILGGRENVMGQFTLKKRLTRIGWAATVVMGECGGCDVRDPSAPGLRHGKDERRQAEQGGPQRATHARAVPVLLSGTAKDQRDANDGGGCVDATLCKLRVDHREQLEAQRVTTKPPSVRSWVDDARGVGYSARPNESARSVDDRLIHQLFQFSPVIRT